MKKITYGKTNTGVFVINREQITLTTTPTAVFDYYSDITKGIVVNYQYDVPLNTFQNERFEEISKKEFDSIIKDIKSNHKVNFTIKLR